MNIKGKVAIVTGASSGIGLATARLLCKNGAKVALVARSENKLFKLSKELPNSLPIVCDMTKEEDIKKMVKKVRDHFGRIDILINNAGRGYDAFVEEVDSKKFRELFELDFLGAVIAMREIISIMKKQKEGVIVNISSGTALMNLPGMGVYASMKRALSHISLTAREELKEDNISISVVYPYVTVTDFEKNTMKNSDDEQTGEEDFYEGLPQPPDTAEYAAEKILEAIESGEAEVFAHDFMNPNK